MTHLSDHYARVGPPQLAIRLFHGREHPETDMQGHWGTDGPVLGPFHWFRGIYLGNYRVGHEGTDESPPWDWWLNESAFRDLLYYGGVFYGDFTISSVHLLSVADGFTIVPFDPSLAVLPEQWAKLR